MTKLQKAKEVHVAQRILTPFEREHKFRGPTSKGKCSQMLHSPKQLHKVIEIKMIMNVECN